MTGFKDLPISVGKNKRSARKKSGKRLEAEHTPYREKRRGGARSDVIWKEFSSN